METNTFRLVWLWPDRKAPEQFWCRDLRFPHPASLTHWGFRNEAFWRIPQVISGFSLSWDGMANCNQGAPALSPIIFPLSRQMPADSLQGQVAYSGEGSSACIFQTCSCGHPPGPPEPLWPSLSLAPSLPGLCFSLTDVPWFCCKDRICIFYSNSSCQFGAIFQLEEMENAIFT